MACGYSHTNRAMRYVLFVAVICLAQTILQLDFSIHHVLSQNIPFRNGLPQFYYADQVGDLKFWAYE